MAGAQVSQASLKVFIQVAHVLYTNCGYFLSDKNYSVGKTIWLAPITIFFNAHIWESSEAHLKLHKCCRLHSYAASGLLHTCPRNS